MRNERLWQPSVLLRLSSTHHQSSRSLPWRGPTRPGLVAVSMTTLVWEYAPITANGKAQETNPQLHYLSSNRIADSYCRPLSRKDFQLSLVYRALPPSSRPRMTCHR